MLPGWLHYVAFDLQVGYVMANQGYDSGVPRLLTLPFLLGTAMFGPAGILPFASIYREHTVVRCVSLIDLTSRRLLITSRY